MEQRSEQMTLFDLMDGGCRAKITDGKKYDITPIVLDAAVTDRLLNYKLNDYLADVESLGLEKTWDYICQFVIDKKELTPCFLDVNNFGELYEIGLAAQDKKLKKKSGQYYTPDDVARVMSEWLDGCEGTAVCDVACGTGKLILTYLDLIGFDKARRLISSGNLYLYDFDNVALKICRTVIALKYGLDIADSINDFFCDFLDPSVNLPKNCKVISNPPYGKLDAVQDYWDSTDVLLDTKELYAAFMEKIFKQAAAAVTITPFSFISGTKFSSLRREMCKLGNGFVVAFDNVPGNIFCGRKHGVFNTNTANSVRAAFTVLHQSDTQFGFRISPLIRFKNEERNALLQCAVLEGLLPDDYQIVDERRDMFEKVGRDLKEIFDAWVHKSEFKIKDIILEDKTDYFIDMPNTCRYYTTACGRKLKRSGSITIYCQNEEQFNFLYCMINSSFTYWWWRIYDGGITYPVGLFMAMPVPFNLLSADDKEFFAKMAKKLRAEENHFVITKMNAGVPQENIKFPEEYRENINKKILSLLGFDLEGSVFRGVHTNRFLKAKDD